MAHRHLWAGLLLGLTLAGCGSGGEQDAAPPPDVAANRARRDSIVQARVREDSLASIRYTACADSMKAVLARSAAGRKALAAAAPDSAAAPAIVTACGARPGTAGLGADSAAGRPGADSTAQQQSIADKETQRETFSYGGGTRDPFVSLINTAKAGPEFTDLQLVGIYQDLRYGRNSVAVVRDRAANKRYNVRVGDRIGRMRVAQIRQRDVVFTVEDLGFERQETLSLPKREELNQ